MELFDWKSLNNLSIILGILSTVFAGCAAIFSGLQRRGSRLEKIRLNQEIFISLDHHESNRNITIPFSLRRREIMRSEILGLIGMLPMKIERKGQRYEIYYLSTKMFREELSRVQDSSDSDTLIIECQPDELNQFDMEKLIHDERR